MTMQTIPRDTSSMLIAYFVLAYVISWIIGVPLALARVGVIQPILPDWSHYVAGYGPGLAAVVVTGLVEGRKGLRILLGRLVQWRVSLIWWMVALSPLVIGVVVMMGMNIVSDSTIALADFGEVRFLPSLGIGALFLWVLTYGIGEELGWRGMALPRLQSGRSALRATLILSGLWALWHLPFFFYLFDPAIAPGWLIGLVAGAIVFTWIFNSTQGSVLMVAIWHGCFNFFTSSQGGSSTIAAVISTIVMVWALVILVVFKPATLSHHDKVIDGVSA